MILQPSHRYQLQYILVKAWEKASWQKNVKLLDSKQISTPTTKKKETRSDAQMVFCIDTRSELIDM
jgi:uncharacterized protein YbcC (UPF0753/DUF2309 family)